MSLHPAICGAVLSTTLAMAPIGVLPQAGRVELDHVFIVVQPEGGAAIGALRSAGFTVPARTAKHDGEGTTSVAVFFENAYLELIWLDSALSVDADHAASARWFRNAGAWRATGHSPFGLGLRRVAGDAAPLPVPVQREPAPWLDPDAAYELLRQPSEARATDLFVVPVQAAVPTWVDRARTRAGGLEARRRRSPHHARETPWSGCA